MNNFAFNEWVARDILCVLKQPWSMCFSLQQKGTYESQICFSFLFQSSGCLFTLLRTQFLFLAYTVSCINLRTKTIFFLILLCIPKFLIFNKIIHSFFPSFFLFLTNQKLWRKERVNCLNCFIKNQKFWNTEQNQEKKSMCPKAYGACCTFTHNHQPTAKNRADGDVFWGTKLMSVPKHYDWPKRFPKYVLFIFLPYVKAANWKTLIIKFQLRITACSK